MYLDVDHGSERLGRGLHQLRDGPTAATGLSAPPGPRGARAGLLLTALRRALTVLAVPGLILERCTLR